MILFVSVMVVHDILVLDLLSDNLSLLKLSTDRIRLAFRLRVVENVSTCWLVGVTILRANVDVNSFELLHLCYLSIHLFGLDI